MSDEKLLIIDPERLRRDLKEDSFGAFFGGGFGGAFFEAQQIEQASWEELVEIALAKGINLFDYEV